MEEVVVDQKLTLSNKIKYFFKSPSILFNQYITRPKYALTFLIFIVVSALYSAAYTIGCKDLIIAKVEEQLQATGQQQAIEFAKMMATNPLIAAASAAVGAVVGVLFASLIYYLIAKFDGGKISYKQMVSIYCLSAIAPAIGYILKSVYMLTAHKPFLIDSMNPTFLSTILGYLDVFNIWQYVLLVIGISSVGKLSKKESIFIVGVCVVASACISLLMLVWKFRR